MQRNARATWKDSLHKGQGRVTTQSASLQDARFSFPTRFGNEHGANPEELIAAAHAACFSMAFVHFAEAAGATPASKARPANTASSPTACRCTLNLTGICMVRVNTLLIQFVAIDDLGIGGECLGSIR